MITYNDVSQALNAAGDPERAKFVMGYFKTGKGGYGENDVFIGLTVPVTRAIAKEYKDLPLKDIQKLLSSEIHEFRLCALVILCLQMKKSSPEKQEELYEFYLKNTKYINNWDLVDLSARDMVGAYLEDKDRSILRKLAHSKDLWEKRISIIATYHFIKLKDYKDTFEITEILLHDSHDLIHKAVGWMLREAGKMDQKQEELFLKKHYKTMPRTMLRYAIERFAPDLRTAYMKGTV